MPITDQATRTQAQRANENLRNMAFATYRRAKGRYTSMLQDFWKDPTGLTPQQVSDALGTDAADLFHFVGNLRTFILAVNPSANIPVPSSFGTWTINGDGTVTINSVN